MKKILLVLFLATGLLAGVVGTAPAEIAEYYVFANYTGSIPNATDDGESATVIYATSAEGMWEGLMMFVASGPGSEEILDIALSANSIATYLLIVTDDAYLEEDSMPIYQIYTLYKLVEEDEEEAAAESFGRKLTPEIMIPPETLNTIPNRQ